MLAIVAAALLAAAPQNDTVFMADGGRVVGTVIEEAAQGITVQLADGTVRRYPAREVLRIEYADGSVSAPRHSSAPAPAPVPPPAPAPPPSAAPPAPAPPQQPAPPPQAYPPQPPPHREPRPYEPRPHRAPPPYGPYVGPAQRSYAVAQPGMPPMSAVYGVFGLGGLALTGQLAEGVSASRTYDPQVALYFEGGLRLDPAVALALYLDLGVGEPASDVRAECDLLGTSCTAVTGRVGILLRHTFTPLARTAPWIAIGTGLEFGSVTLDHAHGSSSDLFTYSGWEALRLMAGVDLRSNPVLGFGLYGAVSFGTYSHYEDAAGEVDVDPQRFHGTVEAGVRLTLFP